MRKYQSVNPSNSRIFINFENKENPVRFEYPDKSSAFSIVLFPIVMIYSWILFIFILVNIPFIVIVLIKNIESAVGIILIGLVALLFSIFIIPLMITLIIISNEKFLRKMPKINFAISRLTGSSINRIYVDELKSKVYEIPVFDNVFLEYKATKDFGKYLEKIEVTEHDFWCISLGLFSRKEKKERNVDYWKVKFYFKRIPKEGLLRVDYI